jgi:multiple sugar transport system ATP-binding protein
MADAHLERVCKRFGTTTAVEDVTLDVYDGEFVVLLGPTGAGKTTTLRLLAGLEVPDTGRVMIGGRDVTGEPPAARDVAFVFQQYSLYPNLSVYDNLAFPLRSPARRLPEIDVDKKVKAIACLLHLEGKLGALPTQLSGGQMQRVAIGRALVRRPTIYLMDEPLSSLDAKLRAELRLELKRIQQELGATILYVTHDQTEAMTLADRIGVLKQGRLVQLGSPRDIYVNPCDTYVATRLGSPRINLLPRSGFPHAGYLMIHWCLLFDPLPISIRHQLFGGSLHRVERSPAGALGRCHDGSFHHRGVADDDAALPSDGQHFDGHFAVGFRAAEIDKDGDACVRPHAVDGR